MTVTQQIRQALKERFPMPEYCLMEEVRDGAGHSSKRSADAVVMSLWPSRGLEVHGFEIKASRGDWLRELKNPDKAESIARYCDRWWVAIGSEQPNAIVKDGELPENWGLMVFNGKKLITKKEALKNPTVAPLDRTFVAAMMRRVGEIDDFELRRKIQSASEEARKNAELRIDRTVKARTHAHAELLEKLAKVKAETGIDLQNWSHSAESVSSAINFALSADIGAKYSALENALRSMENSASALRDAFAILSKDSGGDRRDGHV